MASRKTIPCILTLLLMGFGSHAMTASQESQSAPQNQAVEPATFVLKPGPIRVSQTIYLNDIATCKGNTEVCNEAYGVELGDAPTTGKEIILLREKIRISLQAEWPQREIHVSGSSAIKLISNSTYLNEQDVLNQLEPVLKSAERDGHFRIAIEKLQIPSGILAPDPATPFLFPEFSEPMFANKTWVRQHLNGNQRIKIAWNAHVPEESNRPIAIMANLRLSELLPVATRDLIRGEIIREDDVNMAWFDVDRGTRAILEERDAIVGRKIRQKIRAGSPFLTDATESARVITRGQIAQLLIQRGDLNITGKVQTLSSGAPGDIIEAIYPSTKKRLKVRIIDQSTVESLN